MAMQWHGTNSVRGGLGYYMVQRPQKVNQIGLLELQQIVF